MPEIKFAEILKTLLKTRNIRLEQLAREVGTTKQSISYYTQGKAFPKPEILIKIAEFFGVSVDFLLTGTTPIKAASNLLKLSEKAIENIIALSPDEAQALSETFSDEIDESENFTSIYEGNDANTIAFNKLTQQMMEVEKLLKEFLEECRKEKRDFTAWPQNDEENYNDSQEFHLGLENAAKQENPV